MNNNSSKQILLSVIGVAILVVAVVGVSFAFFTYTKTGTEDNVITTGRLTFSFEDTSWITLTNHFPVDKATEVTGDKPVCEFTVQGSAPAGTELYYDIIAIDGSDRTGTRFGKDEISVYLNPTEDGGHNITNPTAAAGVEGTKLSTLADVNVTEGSLAGKLLADGIITGDANNTVQTAEFEVKMWVDSDYVSINEQTGDNSTDDSIYTSGAYGNMYYTMKIAVVARDTAR